MLIISYDASLCAEIPVRGCVSRVFRDRARRGMLRGDSSRFSYGSRCGLFPRFGGFLGAAGRFGFWGLIRSCC